MADLLTMSADIIDGRVAPNELGPLNRINHQLSELANDLAVVEAFSHCIVFKTDDGLVTFDTSNEHGGKSVSARFSHGHTIPSTRLFSRMDTSITWVAVAHFARPMRAASRRSSAMRTSLHALIAIE